MNKKIVVFDFDGTIAHTLRAGVEILNKYSEEFGFRKIREEEVDGLRGKNIRELLDIFDVSMLKVPFIAAKVKKELANSIDKIEIVPGIRNVFESLEKNGVKVGVLSSNSEENLNKFFEKNNLVFDFVYSGGSIFGKDSVMEDMIKKENFSKEDLFYVGDEVRDIEASKKVGIKIISVSWGFNNREALQKLNPDYLIEKPEEILEILK